MSREFRLVSSESGSAPAPPDIDLTEDKPFLDMGYRIGRLLEDAHNAAEDLKRSAEQEAAVLLQEANRNAIRTKEDAERLARQAKSDAALVLEDARAAAARVGDRVEHDKRLAEAEATVIRREAHRDAKMIKAKAEREAEAIVEKASSRAAERVRELEKKLRVLQHAETELEHRVSTLREKQTSLRAVTKEDAERRLPEEPSPGPFSG